MGSICGTTVVLTFYATIMRSSGWLVSYKSDLYTGNRNTFEFTSKTLHLFFDSAHFVLETVTHTVELIIHDRIIASRYVDTPLATHLYPLLKCVDEL